MARATPFVPLAGRTVTRSRVLRSCLAAVLLAGSFLAVAPLTGEADAVNSWHGYNSRGGDFDGDGRTDIVSFQRASGEVSVSLSEPYRFQAPGGPSGRFVPPAVWHSTFISTQDLPYVGDFNGDGLDDLLAVPSGASAQQDGAWVSLSTGSSFYPPGRWHTTLGNSAFDYLSVADVNGDSLDDVVTFREDGYSFDVRVWLNTGHTLADGVLWADNYPPFEDGTIADVDGDGRGDLVTLGHRNSGIRVALSDGTAFGALTEWGDYQAQLPDARDTRTFAYADVTGDGKDDFISVHGHTTTAATTATTFEYHVLPSDGAGFGPPELWGRVVVRGDPVVDVGTGDVDGDGRTDLTVFTSAQNAMDVLFSRVVVPVQPIGMPPVRPRNAFAAPERWSTSIHADFVLGINDLLSLLAP